MLFWDQKKRKVGIYGFTIHTFAQILGFFWQDSNQFVIDIAD